MSKGNPHNFKIRGHALAVYDVMIAEAYQDDGQLKWAGSVSAIFRQLGINQGYHTPVMRLLKSVNCIDQERRGSRGVKSVYLINLDPRMIPEGDWPTVDSIVKSRPEGLTIPPGGYMLLAQQVRGIEERLGGLDLVRALTELQSQLDLITEDLTKIKGLLNGSQ